MACLDKILKEFPDIDKEEVKVMEDALNRIKRRLESEGKLADIEKVLNKEVKKIINERVITAKEAERNVQLAILKEQGLDDKLAEVTSKGIKREESLRSDTVGSNKDFQGAEDSAYSLSRAIEAELLGGWVREVETINPKILRLLDNKKFNRDVVVEMFHFDKGNTKSLTGNEDAFAFAKITRKHKSRAVKMMNDEGAFIREIDTHVMTQSHNGIKIARMGKTLDESRTMYVAMMKKFLDHDKTFGMADPDDFLVASFNNIVAGEQSTFLARIQGQDKPGSVGRTATGLSRGRKFHFKDAESFLEYNDKFGTAQPIEGIVNNFHNAAKHTALMRRFGPDSANLFTKQLDKVVKKVKFDKKSGLKDLLTERKRKKLQNEFDEVSGVSTMSENLRLSDASAMIRNINSMISLGASAITSMTDIVTGAANLHYHGVGYLSSYHETLKGLGGAISARKLNKALALDLTDTFIDGIRGSVANRLNLGGGGRGNVAKLASTFFKLNGLQWWTNVMKEGHAFALSRHLAKNMKSSFDDLPSQSVRLLRKHGISQKDWQLIQQSKTKLANNKEYITPDGIRNLDKSLFKGRNEQRDLENKLRSLFIAESEVGTPTPGAKEKAFARTGNPGSVMGTAGELFWQFKMFPLTLASKVWPRQNETGVLNLARFMAMTTLFGYASLSLKDMVKGRKPRDPHSTKTWSDSFVNGGGAGIFGDFLFQDFNVYGRDFLSTLSGPTFGRVNDIASIFALARQGETNSATKALTFLTRNVPFANLFYVKAIMSHLIMPQFAEAINPGSFKRIEKRIKEDNNQEYYDWAKRR